MGTRRMRLQAMRGVLFIVVLLWASSPANCSSINPPVQPATETMPQAMLGPSGASASTNGGGQPTGYAVVAGNGHATTENDLLELDFTITATASSADEAQAIVSEARDGILDALKELNVNTTSDVKTTAVSLKPETRPQKVPGPDAEDGEPSPPPDRPSEIEHVPTGNQTYTESLEVILPDSSAAGKALDALGTANGVNDAQVTVDSFYSSLKPLTEQQLRANARSLATTDAQEQAKTYAELLGGQLGKVLWVSERPPPAGLFGGGGSSGISDDDGMPAPMAKMGSANAVAYGGADSGVPEVAFVTGGMGSADVVVHLVYELLTESV